jgi:hypothetical protein
VTHSKPYLVTKALGEFLVVFVVCTQCLDDLVTRGREGFIYGANEHDRELIDEHWQPMFSGDGPPWKSNEYPDNQVPAGYLLSGIRFVVPHRHSGWREDDERTYDGIPS